MGLSAVGGINHCRGRLVRSAAKANRGQTGDGPSHKVPRSFTVAKVFFCPRVSRSKPGTGTTGVYQKHVTYQKGDICTFSWLCLSRTSLHLSDGIPAFSVGRTQICWLPGALQPKHGQHLATSIGRTRCAHGYEGLRVRRKLRFLMATLTCSTLIARRPEGRLRRYHACRRGMDQVPPGYGSSPEHSPEL